MSLSSKMEAIRRLAERPGTESEGIVAREMLKRLEGKHSGPLLEGERWEMFRAFLRTGNMDDLERACGRPIISHCPCGAKIPAGEKCSSLKHESIRMEIAVKFPVGSVVFYNAWAYPLNCRGRIVRKPRPNVGNWNWYPVSFDHLKSPRSVPVLTTEGWRLSLEPITTDEALKLGWGRP